MGAWNWFKSFWTPPEPPTGQQLLEQLLEDARIVASYQQRAGILPDSLLVDAISRIDDTTPRSWNAPEFINLQLVFNHTMNALHPITIDTIRGYAPPFVNNGYALLKTLFLLALTASAVLVTAIFTLQFSYGNSIAADLEELKASQLHKSVRLTAHDIIEEIRGSSSETNTDLLKSQLLRISEARDAQNDISEVLGIATEYVNANNNALNVLPIVNWSSPQVTTLAYLPEDYQSEDTQEPPAASNYDPCNEKSWPALGIKTLVDPADAQLFKAGCGLGIIGGAYYYPIYESLTWHVKRIVNIYGLWLLPAAYGALGGLAYHMRRAINPTLPNPYYTQVLTRFLLASAVGIIISSLWGQTISTTDIFKNAGLNLFAVCFLVGYSLNVFFEYLDSLVERARDSMRRKPPPPPPPSPNPPQPAPQPAPAPAGH